MTVPLMPYVMPFGCTTRPFGYDSVTHASCDAFQDLLQDPLLMTVPLVLHVTPFRIYYETLYI